jgi:threonine dehydrogenase-like Zn-dependent dehydrogenase
MGYSPFFSLHNCTLSNLYVSFQPGDYKLAIQLAAQGKIDLKPLVTHR